MSLLMQYLEQHPENPDVRHHMVRLETAMIKHYTGMPDEQITSLRETFRSLRTPSSQPPETDTPAAKQA